MPDSIRDTNKAVARQVISAWNQRGETHLPDRLVHPQFVRFHPQPVGFAARGSDVSAVDAALPRTGIHGQQFKEDMVIADENYAFIAWSMSGQHRGELYGRKATGSPVTVRGADLIRLVDGKVIEHWDYYSKSRVQALAQLGLLDKQMQEQLIQQNLLSRNRRL